MGRDTGKKFEQILIRSVSRGNQVDYEVIGFFEALESIEKALQENPGNSDFVKTYRTQIATIRSLLISALIEALDGLDRKIGNLEGISALLQNIAQIRQIQSRNDLVAVINLVIENFNKYDIGLCANNQNL